MAQIEADCSCGLGSNHFSGPQSPMQTEDHHRDVCTMCGDLCAIKVFDRVSL